MPKVRVGMWIAMLTLVTAPVIAQQRPAPRMPPPSADAAKAQPAAPPIANDAGETQQKLMALLKVSPTLGDILSYDPNLLSDPQYIGRYNPELVQFLEQHPEVARNPQFYLFSDIRGEGHRNYELLSPRAGFEERHN